MTNIDPINKKGTVSAGDFPTSSPSVTVGAQKLLDSNPYMNLDYTHSGWQQFLEGLGFRTGYNQRQEDMQLQANEYNAQLALMDYQNEYNSPAAQAARMRAAGMNPDLLGTGDVAGAASMSEDTNPPAPTESDGRQVTQFANMIFGAVSTSIGLMKDIQGLKQISTAIEAGNIDNARETYNLALQAVLGASPADPFVQDEEHGSYLAAGITDKIASDAKSAFGKGLSRKRRQYYEAAVDQLVGSLPATKDQYEGWKQQMQSKIGMFQTYNSPEYSPWEPAMSAVSKRVMELLFKHKTSGLDKGIAENIAGKAHAENISEFESVVDPTLAAQSENAANQASRAQSSIQASMKETLEGIVKDLQGIADEGGLKGFCANLLLFSFSLMSLTNMSVSQKNGFSIGF